MSFQNLNKFYGLKIEDEDEESELESNINFNTNNELRKLRKKLREISILEEKDFSLLNQEQINKLKKKNIIIENLNNLYKKKDSITTPKVKIKKTKNLKELEKEQIEYQQQLLNKKKERKEQFNTFWRDKYKKYESYNSYPTNKILAEACKTMNLKITDINQDILKSQYHKLALKCHPDKGGTHHQMVNLSSSYGIIKKFLELQ